MIKVVTGNEAAAYGAMLSRPKLICAYPITPQSRIPELLSEFCAKGILDGDFINVESEMGAINYVTGASSGGIRVFTATASQGLAWMHEGLHNVAGSRLPIVMVIVNRPLCAPANLTCDQTDSLSQRDTGWMQFYCESNQEILDTVIQAYKISETVSLPSMVCMDGIYLSHVSESIEIPDQKDVDQFLPPYEPSYRHDGYTYKLYANYPLDQVGYQRESFMDYMKARSIQHRVEATSIEVVEEVNENFKEQFGRGYEPVESYLCDDADIVVVTSGSTVGTVRAVVDDYREKGKSVGLVKIKMFRPFPKGLIRKALNNKKKIMVIDRNLSVGQCGIMYQEIKWALNSNGDISTGPIFGFVAGLGGIDITQDLIQSAIDHVFLHEKPQDEFQWLGLGDKKIRGEHE